MALVRKEAGNWLDPWRDIDERMAKWLEGGALTRSDWAPSVDVVGTDTEYKLHASLPDVKKEDIHVTFERGTLTIRGERKSRKEEPNEKWHRTEIATGSFLRSFSMPGDADAENIKAKYENGVLDVVIAKARPKPPAGRKVDVT